MLLPEKHITLSESIIGLSVIILNVLDQPKTLDELWKATFDSYEQQKLATNFNLDKLILTIDYLFAIGLVNLDKNGKLSR